MSRVIGNKLASGVLEAIAIGLIKQGVKNSNNVLIITSEVTGMYECETNSNQPSLV